MRGYGTWKGGSPCGVVPNMLDHCEQYWTSPGGKTPQSTNYTATCLPSWKLSKLDEPDMQDTAGEPETSS